ncbi:MAG: AGE family epimerase/isomerase [Candidatus Hydrogenedentes bacterium]|nr:AGE family epimerase/isomerase [Candidatus Hydrogenedentota bacterium]
MKLNEYERKQLLRVRELAEHDLSENLMPFWARNSWDNEYGGFLTRLDRRGNRLDDSEKVLMMQVRMIHSLSSAHRHGLQDHGYLDLAGRGFDFVVQNMWDGENGGFYFSVGRDGTPLSRRKNTDFHGYVMTSFAEYYQASGRKDALDWAGRAFDVLLAKASDGDRGFIEDFDGADWPALNSEQMNLGRQAQVKTIDMHTNVMEGMMYLARASAAPRHKQALQKLVNLICARGIHNQYGCSVTVFDYDWNPLADVQGRMTTSYGLNAEMAWILFDSADVLGATRDAYRHSVLGLIDHALEFGFDHECGGLAAFGPLTGPVLNSAELGEGRLLKSWWAQAELLNALIQAFAYTEQRKYLEAFLKEFEWVHAYQIDHECGDWFQDTDWKSGRPLHTDKGLEFKTSFHAGRALIRVADAIRAVLLDL